MSILTRRYLLRMAMFVPFPQVRAANAANAVPPRAKRVRQLPDTTNCLLCVTWSAGGKLIAAGGLHGVRHGLRRPIMCGS